MNSTSTREFIPSATRNGVATLNSPRSDAHRKRAELFDRLWDYYRGRHRDNIKHKPGQANDNVAENWSKKIVNMSRAFLFGKPVTFETDDATERNQAEQYLDGIWSDDATRDWQPQRFLLSLAQSGGVCGTAFVRLHVDESGVPRMVNIDPSTVDIVTDPDDKDQVQAYHIVWLSGDTWKRHRIEATEGGWEIGAEMWQRGRWVPEMEPEAWPYSFPPMFHCQNLINYRDVWGMSDIEDADINDAINFVASNTNRIVRFHAHPRTIGTGFMASQMESTSVDQFWTIPSEGAQVFNLEMASDLASSRQHRADLVESFHQVTDTPMLTPERVNLGALSGFALQMLYSPLLQKTNEKRLTYGGLLKRLNAALLELGGFGSQTVEILWPSPLPSDSKERAEIFATLTRTGQVDVYAAARIAGYSKQEAEDLAADTLPPVTGI